MIRFLKSLFETKRPPTQSRRKARVGLESLEDRVVFSNVPAAEFAPIQRPAAITRGFHVPVTMTTDQVTRLYGQNVEFFASVRRADTGVYLTGAVIKFYVDGQFIGATKPGGSMLSLPFSSVANFHGGTHAITAKFDGDNYFAAGSAANKYIVYRSNATLTSNFASGKTGTTVLVNATIVDKYTSAPLAGKKIDVTIDNRFYGTYVTDAKGRISYSYRIPQPGGHIVAYAFAGDIDYNKASGTGTISGS